MNIINYIEIEGNVEVVDTLFINIGHIYNDIRNFSESVIEKFTYLSASIDASTDKLILFTPKVKLVFSYEQFTKNLNSLLVNELLKTPSLRKEILAILIALDYFFKKYQINYVRYIGVPYVYLI